MLKQKYFGSVRFDKNAIAFQSPCSSSHFKIMAPRVLVEEAVTVRRGSCSSHVRALLRKGRLVAGPTGENVLFPCAPTVGTTWVAREDAMHGSVCGYHLDIPTSAGG